MKWKICFLYLFYSLDMCFNFCINTMTNGRTVKKHHLTKPQMSDNIFHNSNSYYNQNKIISNISKNIDRIFTTYNHNYSLIFYKDGSVEESLNKTLKLKPEQDVLEIHFVSMPYFIKLYDDYNKSHTKNKLRLK